DTVVLELVVNCLPRLSAVVRALDHLPEPPAGLRRIDPVRVRWRALQVVNLPAREVRAADIPLLAPGVRCQDERTLACTDQNSHSTHSTLLPLLYVSRFPECDAVTTLVQLLPNRTHAPEGPAKGSPLRQAGVTA